MKLDIIDRISLDDAVNAFMATGQNDYYEFSRTELKKIILNNPNQIILISPEGEIITYNLKPSEHHYVGFLKYHKILVEEKNIELPKSEYYIKLNYAGKDSEKNDAANEICKYLLKHNYIVIQSWFRKGNLTKFYGIPTHKNLTNNQEKKFLSLLEELNLTNDFIEKEDFHGVLYSIPFEFQKNKNTQKIKYR